MSAEIEASSQQSLRPPWGEVHLAPGATVEHQLGPLSLWMHRTETELACATHIGEDPLSTTAAVVDPHSVVPEDAWRGRWVLGPHIGAIRLAPALADRAVVVRPEHPLTLLPGDQAVVYVGTQLWLTVSAGDRLLAEWPTFRLSDTWFGSSTRSGELCYASRTRARTQREDVPIRAARALTRLQLENHAKTPLVLERLKVPVEHLALYLGEDGRFWTQSLQVQRTQDATLVDVQVHDAAPTEAGAAHFITPPRSPIPGAVKRALEALIG